MKNSGPVCSSRSRYNTISVVLILLCLVGCVSVLYIPTRYDAVSQNVPLETLTKGRNLYVKNCGSCHNLYLPARFTKTEWTRITQVMKDRAKITTLEVQQINQYLGVKAKKE